MSSRFTKKSLVSVPGRSVKTPCCGLPDVGVQGAHAADQHRHLGRGQRQHVRPVQQQRAPAAASRPAGGSCGSRRPVGSSTANDSTSVCSCEASVRPGANGTVTSCPASFAACSTAAQPPRTIRSASETLLPPDWDAVEVLLDLPRGVCSTFGELGRLVDLPVLLRREADPRAVGAAALVGAAEASPPTPRRWRPAGRSTGPEARIFALEGGDVLLADQLVVDRGDRVLPQLRLRDPRAEVARDRPHVAVQQLVPGLGERVGELVRVLVEALRDRLVDRVQPSAPGPSSASSARAASTDRARRARCPGPRGSSASTASRRRGSSSAPSRTRTGSRGSRCPTSSARWSRRPRARW